MGIYDTFSNSTYSVETKSEHELSNNSIMSVVSKVTEKQQDDPTFKYKFPMYLYKPIFGYPRNLNVPFLRQVSKNIYYESIHSAIKEAVASADWDIVPKEGITLDSKQDELDRLYCRHFFENPNSEDESFGEFQKKIVDDILTLESGVINKVYSRRGELVQMKAIDGGQIVKNPDVYGNLSGKADYIPDSPLTTYQPRGKQEAIQAMQKFETQYDSRAAYYQYSSTLQFSIPIAFGRKEIVYIQLNPTTEGVYSKTSKVQSSIELALSLIYGSKYNLDFYINGSTPEGIIQVAGLNQEEANALRDKLKESMSEVDNTLGTNRRVGWRLPVIGSEAVNFQPLSFSSREMEIIAQQKWFHRVLLMIYGLTSDFMGITEDSNKTNGEMQDSIAMKKAIKPILKALEHYYTKEILSELPGGDKFRFKFDDFDINQYKAKLEVYKQELELGITTPEIIAKEEGKDIKALEEYKKKQQEEQQALEQENSNEDNVEEVEQKSFSDKYLDTLSEVELKHKYISRSGKPGNYKYVYAEGSNKKVSEKKEDSKKGNKSLFEKIASKFKFPFAKFEDKLDNIMDFMEAYKEKLQNKAESGSKGSSSSSSGSKSKDNSKSSTKGKDMFEKFGLGDLSKSEKELLLQIAKEYAKDSSSSNSNKPSVSFNSYHSGEKTLEEISKEANDKFGKDFQAKGDYLYNTYKDELLKDLATFEDRGDPSSEKFKRDSRNIHLLHKIKTQYVIAESKDDFVTQLVEDMRSVFNNDTIQINKVLRSVNIKERVTKSGFRNTNGTGRTIAKKTALEIEKNMSVNTSKKTGITYAVSPSYIKGDTNFKNEKELNSFVEDSLALLPEKAQKKIKDFGTVVKFVNKTEAKTLSQARFSSRTLGFYTGDRDVYILAKSKETKLSTNIDTQAMKDRGYSEDTINKLKAVSGREVVKNVIVHELGHAAALNDRKTQGYYTEKEGEFQQKYDDFVFKQLNSYDRSDYITNYAQTNSKEDFAETFAFYAQNRDVVDSMIEKDEGILPKGLIERFKFMKKEVFN